jgi:uncharacterized protein (DUF4415 family)
MSNISRTEGEQLQAEFTADAAQEASRERVMVMLDVDADLCEWLKGQSTDWQEINSAMRFFTKNERL